MIISYHPLAHDLCLYFDSVVKIGLTFVVARHDIFTVGVKLVKEFFPLAQTIFFDFIFEYIPVT